MVSPLIVTARGVEAIDILHDSLSDRENTDAHPQYALEAATVHQSGAETIAGAKTFSVPIIGSLGQTVAVPSPLYVATTALFAEGRLTGDIGARMILRPDGTFHITNGTGEHVQTHTAGIVGAGSDSPLYIEHNRNTAHILHIQHGRVQVVPDGNPGGVSYMTFSADAAYAGYSGDLSAGTGVFYLHSAAGFATAGSFNVRDVRGVWHSGTFTGKTATTLTGVTTTYRFDTDTTVRHSLWITDAFGAPIMWLSNYGGLHITDEITFRQGVGYPTEDRSLGMNYLWGYGRANPALVFFGDSRAPEDTASGINVDNYKGTYIRRVGARVLKTTGVMRGPDGSLSAPSWSFTNYQGTGFYRTSTQLRLAFDGALAQRFTALGWGKTVANQGAGVGNTTISSGVTNVDASTTNRTKSLPGAALHEGISVIVSKTDATGNAVIISGAVIAISLTVQHQSVTLTSDGNVWRPTGSYP